MRMEESDHAEKVLCTVLNQKNMEVEEKVDQNYDGATKQRETSLGLGGEMEK